MEDIYGTKSKIGHNNREYKQILLAMCDDRFIHTLIGGKKMCTKCMDRKTQTVNK